MQYAIDTPRFDLLRKSVASIECSLGFFLRGHTYIVRVLSVGKSEQAKDADNEDFDRERVGQVDSRVWARQREREYVK